MAVGLAGCASFRHGVAAFLRGTRDYDELEEERAGARGSSWRADGDHAAPRWTRYRGPDSAGVYREQPVAFPEDGEPPEVWRAAVGPAYSSIVVALGLAITLEQRRGEEAVVAFALEDGGLVWDHAWEARHYDVASKEGPRATPVIAGDAVVALGATGEVRCLDLATGALRWRRNLLADEGHENLEYGLAASPLVRGDAVVVQGASRVWSLALADGRPRWRALAEEMAYASPRVATLLDRETLLVTTGERVVGLDPDTGAELWSFPWKVSGGGACTQPVPLPPDRVLVSAGYGKGSQLMVLERTAEGTEPRVGWRSSRFKTRFNEPVLVDGLVYGLDEGRLACCDPATGRLRWKEGRYGYGQVLATDAGLVVVDELGTVHLVAIDADGPRELARFEAFNGGTSLPLPALAHGRLLLRNERELACFDTVSGQLHHGFAPQ